MSLNTQWSLPVIKAVISDLRFMQPTSAIKLSGGRVVEHDIVVVLPGMK